MELRELDAIPRKRMMSLDVFNSRALPPAHQWSGHGSSSTSISPTTAGGKHPDNLNRDSSSTWEDSEHPRGLDRRLTYDERMPNFNSQALTAAGKRPPREKGMAFYLVFLSLCVSSFLSAMDLTAVSTALPTIVSELNGGGEGSFVWIGSAFALSGTAILPWTGGLAMIFGRRDVLIVSLILFAIGSVLCGAAINIPMLLVGRTIQGLGDGGIISLAEIIVSDLVPLSERGTWEGVLGVVWAIASVAGPPLGGVLTEYASWRWIFYLNIPVAIGAILLVKFFMKMKAPTTTFREKIARMDWWGNLLVIAATTAITVAISFGGVRYAWSSPAIIVPLIAGFIALILFFYVELYHVIEPTIPMAVVNNRTSLLAYLGVLLHGAIALAVIYVLPTYFQACLGASASGSGVKILPLAFTIAPAAMVAAVSIEMTGIYRIQNWIGWGLTVIGLGIFLLLEADSHPALWITAQIPLGAGLGVGFTAPQFPALAPLDPRWAAQALALFVFVSSFGQTFGIVIGDALLQNTLLSTLPPAFLEEIAAKTHSSSSLGISSIPFIPDLPEPLKREVRVAFAKSCRSVWIALLPMAAVGLLTCFGLKAFELHEDVDEEFAME